MEPYIEQRVYQNWRWNYNTGGGQLLDWIGHHGDIAHWGLGFDTCGPSEVEGTANFRPPTPSGTPPPSTSSSCTYRKEVTGIPSTCMMTIAGGTAAIPMGTKWIGTDGWVWVDRGGFDGSNPEWAKMESLPENLRKTPLYESKEHRRNFLDCVRSRKPTIAPVEVAHHSTIPGHLGLISMLVGRKIKWDVARSRFKRSRRHRVAVAPVSVALQVGLMRPRRQLTNSGLAFTTRSKRGLRGRARYGDEAT